MGSEFVGLDPETRRALEHGFKHMLLAANVAQAVQQSIAGGGRLTASAFCSATAGVAAALKLTDVEREQLNLYHAEPADAAADTPDVSFCAREDFICFDKVRSGLCHRDKCSSPLNQHARCDHARGLHEIRVDQCMCTALALPWAAMHRCAQSP